MARKGNDKRLYYKIGEACKQLDIQPYVLRYWETEFPILSPSKSRSGQRVYSEKELRIIRRIKELLYSEGYTIAGAKKKLESELEGDGEPELSGDEAADGGDSLDTSAADRIKTLEVGIGQALEDARAILQLLGAGPAEGR